MRSQQMQVPKVTMNAADPSAVVRRALTPELHLREVGTTREDAALLARLLTHPPAWDNALPMEAPPLEVVAAVQRQLERGALAQHGTPGTFPWVPGVIPPPFARPEQIRRDLAWDLPAYR